MRRPIYRSSFKPRSIRKSESKAKKQLMMTAAGIIVLCFVFFTWVLPFIIGSLSFLNKSAPKTAADTNKVDEAIAPPVLYIPFESTNSAELTISGYSSPLSKVEIYIDDELKSSINSDSEGKFNSSSISLNLGTNNVYAITVNDADKKSLPSKTIKLYYNNEKPKLEVSEPSDNKVIDSGDKKVHVVGITDPDNSVTVNGATVIVNSDGNFQGDVNLNDGDNTITIITTNSFGNTNQIQKIVKYNSQASPSPSPNP